MRRDDLIDGPPEPDGADPSWPYAVQGDDVVTGGAPPRSRRAALVIAAVAVLLVAEPVWHAIAPEHSASPPRPLAAPSAAPDGGLTPTPAPSGGGVPTDSASVDGNGVPRPRPRGSDFALLRWYVDLPIAPTRVRPRRATSAFRVRHSAGYAGAEDFGAAAQVRTRRGWVDVVHGDVGLGRPDARGDRVAFTIGRLGPQPDVRSWVFVVSVRDARVLTSLRVPRDATVLGWFGPYAVVARRFAGRSPVLVDSAGRQAPRDLGDDVVVLRDGAGDVQLATTGADECASAPRLGIVGHRGVEICPDDGLLGLSPSGRWGLTRDLRWLDTRAVRYRPVARRPPGRTAVAAEIVDDRRALVTFAAGRRAMTVVCARDGGCARLR